MMSQNRGHRRFASLAFAFALLSVAFWAFASVRLMRRGLHPNVPAGKAEIIGHLERLVASEPTAAHWHALGDAYVDSEEYSWASDAYKHAASVLRARHDMS